jgi:hypothetical protein
MSFYSIGNAIYVLYINDSLIVGPNKEELDQVIADIKAAKLNITIEREIKDFLGVNIECHDHGTMTFKQPQLIYKILKALHLDGKTVKTKPFPAVSSRIFKGTVTHVLLMRVFIIDL